MLLKILIVHPQMALYGGAELVVVKLAKYLMKQNYQVSIATLSVDKHKEYEGLDFILPPENSRVSYRLRGGLDSIYDVFKMQAGLSNLCRENVDKFDVVNVHNFPAIWATPNHRKIVWMCNEVPDLWHNAKVNGILNKAFNVARFIDSQIVNSKKPVGIVADQQCANIYLNRYNLYPHIIPYGIDGDFYSKAQHKPTSKQFAIMCSAMISPSKNQLEILEAVKKLKGYIPNIKVILSGYREEKHPYSIMLNNYIKEHNLNVQYILPTSREKVREAYSMCNVAVFAGKGQGSWLSPFELISMSIPVIVSNRLTCSDLIQEKDIGIVTNDIEGALLKVYNDYAKYKLQAVEGQKYVLKELTWDKFGSRMEQILCSSN